MSSPGPYDQTYRHLFRMAPPDTVQYGESDADVLSPSRGFMAGFDYTMQLQVGCPGGCLFCYVPSGPRFAPAAVRGPNGSRWGFEVRTKRNAISKFRRHLEAGDLADRTVYWSGVTDPYAAPPVLTRALWETLCAAPAAWRPRRIAIQTRFRPDRDADLLARYARATTPTDGGPPILVSYSLGTDRDDLIRAWERATPPFRQRMAAIQGLRGRELCVVATLSPFGPWHDLRGALMQLDTWGVAYITLLFFKAAGPGAATPAPFRAYLAEAYPEVLDPTWQQEQLAIVQSVFGPERVLVGQPGFASLAGAWRR